MNDIMGRLLSVQRLSESRSFKLEAKFCLNNFIKLPILASEINQKYAGILPVNLSNNCKT